VEHFTIDTMIRKIHNEISNIMPVLSCSLVLKKKGSEEVEIVPSSEDITGNKNVTDIFNRAIELNDSYITDEYIAIPVKIVEDNQSVLICYKDPQSRQLREEEIRIIYSVSRLIGMFIDRFELFQKLQYLSNTDGLTGLHNHRFFHTRLEEEVARSSRSGRPLSLLIMDMDNFKEVNDRFGHQEGDRVLSHIAGILKDAFRHSDVIARYGGDEFAGILPETDVNSALNIAKRVSDKIKNTEITVAKEKIKLTLCTGIASISGEEVISSREIVSRADTALYNAKKTGSGTIKVF
jgi:diguanylate cyclase (GGDEF)-like protein